jgi:MaoC like domain
VTLRHEVIAFNTATASTNKIHDDDVARQYGFRGGLVPGVDVFAYMTHVPVAHWAIDFLRHGWMTARFAKPVYDGEQVTVSGTRDGEEIVVELSGPDAVVRATGRASLAPPTTDRVVPPEAPRPDQRPPASAESLRPGTVLGSIADEFDPLRARDYLAAVREDLTIYTDGPYAHPGWLLRFANSILTANVVLGPWIHVSSEVALLGVVGNGQAIDVHAAVVDEYERRGHRFVELDVAILAEGDVVQRIHHTAIHTPRRVT